MASDHDDRPLIVVNGTLENLSEEDSAFFRMHYRIEHVVGWNREKLIKDLRTGKYPLYAFCFVEWQPLSRLDAELIEAFPDTIRIICIGATGFDMVHMETATRRGIWVTNAPGGATEATADMAMMLMLASCRQAYYAEQQLRKGLWRTDMRMGMRLVGRTMGIVGGGGRIGMAIASRAVAFGMKIIYTSPSGPKSAATEKGYQYHTLDGLFANSDVLVLSCPATVDNRHMINRESLEKMKNGSVIVNIARGSLIDEEALVDALNSGKLFAAGLDVFDREPAILPALQNHDRVTLTPHCAWQTTETRAAFDLAVLKNVHALFTEGSPINPVNEFKQG